MDQEELNIDSSMVAMNNDGIRLMALELIRELENIYGVGRDGEG